MFDVISTLSYLFLFTAGAALAAHAAAVRRLVGSAPLWLQGSLWLVALRLVAVPTETAYGLLTGAGAVLIVGLAFGTPAIDRVLSNQPVLTWLGRISYGLYLVHLPIILTCVHLLYARLPLPAIFGIAIVLSLGAAEIMHRAVEQPSIALGRKLAALRAFRWTMPLRA
jgi:peptidoglycan/LPS O-acetylase OafA/YrhL